MLSATLSQGSILGCCLKSVNHEHPTAERRTPASTEVQIPRFARDDIRASRSALRAPRSALNAQRSALNAPRLPLTPHLPCPMAAKQIHCLVGAVGGGLDPHPVIAGAEARVVANRRR